MHYGGMIIGYLFETGIEVRTSNERKRTNGLQGIRLLSDE